MEHARNDTVSHRIALRIPKGINLYACMFDDKKKFLFRCKECQMIISVDLEEEEDLKDVHEDKLVLSCPCGGKSYVLRD